MSQEDILGIVNDRFICGDFNGALDLCYQQLLSTSEIVEKPVLERYKPLLRHQCIENCVCEKFLSLTVQFMFELRYPTDYIQSFLTNFYCDCPQLPFICVNLLVHMYIVQRKYELAKEILQQCFSDSKERSEPWSREDIEKYHQLFQIFILYVLSPQKNITLAKKYLEDPTLHPPAVLPLPETVKRAPILSSIVEINELHSELSSEKSQILPNGKTDATHSSSNSKLQNRPKSTSPVRNIPFSQFKYLFSFKFLKNSVRLQKSLFIAIFLAVIGYLSYSKKSKANKIFSGTIELLENAFTFGTARAQRYQRMHLNNA